MDNLEEEYFVYPSRELWSDLGQILGDEEPDLAPAEDVLSDIILFEVGE